MNHAFPRQCGKNMRQAIAIAKAKVRERYNRSPQRQLGDDVKIGREISKAILGVMIVAGAIIGLAGIIFLYSGVVRSGGLYALMQNFFSAITG